jgi:nitroreductase
MIAATTFMLSATSHGLATCVMEGFDSHRVARALDIPTRYEVPVIISIGHTHPEDPLIDKVSPRFALQDMVRRDTFGAPWTPPQGGNNDTNER